MNSSNNPALSLHLQGNSHQDSFLTVSPNKRKKHIALTNSALGLRSNLKKTWLSRSIEDLSIDINKTCTEFRKNQKGKKAAMKKKMKVSFAMDLPPAPPSSTPRNNAAATQIQRIARGRWQQLRFRLIWLQYQLDTNDERTKLSLQRVEERLQQKKDAFRSKLENKAEVVRVKRATQESSVAKESQNIIEFLQKENRKFRLKNDKIAKANRALRSENERLENANVSADEYTSTLTDQVKDIEETYDKLMVVVPMYKASVEKMQDAVERRRMFCLAEHRIRLSYVRCATSTVELMEDGCKDLALVNQVVDLCLSLEGEENAQALPPKLDAFFQAGQADGSDSSDNEEYDEYTVTTMD